MRAKYQPTNSPPPKVMAVIVSAMIVRVLESWEVLYVLGVWQIKML